MQPISSVLSSESHALIPESLWSKEQRAAFSLVNLKGAFLPLGSEGPFLTKYKNVSYFEYAEN